MHCIRMISYELHLAHCPFCANLPLFIRRLILDLYVYTLVFTEIIVGCAVFLVNTSTCKSHIVEK